MKQFLLVLSLLIAHACFGQTYSIVNSSPYNATDTSGGIISTGVLSGNSVSGDSLFISAAACLNPGCSSTTTTVAFTDNAGSHGAGGNNTYTTDAQFPASQSYAAALGRSFNVSTTTSVLTGSATPSQGPNFAFAFEIEVSGLGVSPTLESTGQNQQGSGATMALSTSGSCTINDFAWFYIVSAVAPSLPSGWTAVGTPANAAETAWIKVTGTGVLTANFTGLTSTTAGAIACYAPTPAGSAAHTSGGPSKTGGPSISQ